MKVRIHGRNIFGFIVLRMGMASLAPSAPLYLAFRTAATTKNTITARMVSSVGTNHLLVSAFHPNIETRSVQHRSSLGGSRMRFLSSSFSSASSLRSSSLDDKFSRSSSTPSTLHSAPLSPLDENYFLNQVETTISNVLDSHGTGDDIPGDVIDILDLPGDQREAYGVARHIDRRLRSLRKNNDCPRCWMQRRHCICGDCGPVDLVGGSGSDFCIVGGGGSSSSDTNDDDNSTAKRRPKGSLDRIFVIVHHKEIGLKVDTAKLILAAFPFQCELVVGGIGPDHQTSMKKLLQSVEDPKKTSLLLFPDDTAKTLEEIVADEETRAAAGVSTINTPAHSSSSNNENDDNNGSHTKYDLIVLDGTWAQARKFHARYFPQHPRDGDASTAGAQPLRRVKLSEAAVGSLQEGSVETGHQLRRHDIPWRQVGTFEAVRLFLRDWSKEFPSDPRPRPETGRWLEPWEQIESYQRLANEAALRELGPPRVQARQ